MWGALKLGKPWMGIVKNRSKNGDHYWVNAYVTPIFEGREVVGYESVRVKPTVEQIRRGTTQEVASHVQRTADATQEANVLTGRGREVARDTREAIQRLSAVVGETGLTVAQLAKDSNEIT
jgi:hypothetical protein